MSGAARYVGVLLLGVLVGAEGASRWNAPRDSNECVPWSRWISEKPITIQSGPMEFSGKVLILGCKAKIERLSVEDVADPIPSRGSARCSRASVYSLQVRRTRLARSCSPRTQRSSGRRGHYRRLVPLLHERGRRLEALSQAVA
jgi:hypothetical protein